MIGRYYMFLWKRHIVFSQQIIISCAYFSLVSKNIENNNWNKRKKVYKLKKMLVHVGVF